MKVGSKMCERKNFFWFISVLFMLIGFGIYANSMNVPFIFDDFENIKNPNLRIESLTLEELKSALLEGMIKTRPVSNFSFGINYYIGGYKVQGYHLINIVIHILTAIFFMQIISETLILSKTEESKSQNLIVFFSGLVWLVHPLATQSVTYIVQRMNSMAAMFILLSLLLYILGRKKMMEYERIKSNQTKCFFIPVIYFACSFVAGLLALGSKEIAITLPILVLLYEYYFFQNLRLSWLKKKALFICLMIGVIFVFAWIYTDGQLIKKTFGSGRHRDFTTLERVLTELRVIVHYFTQIIYPDPSRLVFDYNIAFSTSLFKPFTTLLSGVLICCAVVYSFWVAHKDRIVSFCILWFFINLALESSIIGLELVFEHRTYLPSTFIIFLFIYLLFKEGKKTTFNCFFLLVIALVFSCWTIERNRVWQDPVTFWQDSINKYPGKFRAHQNLGTIYLENGNLDAAERELEKAISLKPKKIYSLFNSLGVLRFKQGLYAEAEDLLVKSHRKKPRYAPAIRNLGELYYFQKKYEKVVSHYTSVLQKYAKPKNLLSKELLAFTDSLIRIGDYKRAEKYGKVLLVRDENDVKTLMLLAEVYEKTDRKKFATQVYEEVVKIDSKMMQANYNLAMNLVNIGQVEKALYHYEIAADNKEEYQPVNYNYGNLLLKTGEFKKAEEQYKVILNEVNVLPDLMNNLGLAEVQQEKYEAALYWFEKAFALDRRNMLAKQNIQLVKEILKEEVKER